LRDMNFLMNDSCLRDSAANLPQGAERVDAIS